MDHTARGYGVFKDCLTLRDFKPEVLDIFSAWFNLLPMIGNRWLGYVALANLIELLVKERSNC